MGIFLVGDRVFAASNGGLLNMLPFNGLEAGNLKRTYDRYCNAGCCVV